MNRSYHGRAIEADAHILRFPHLHLPEGWKASLLRALLGIVILLALVELRPHFPTIFQVSQQLEQSSSPASSQSPALVTDRQTDKMIRKADEGAVAKIVELYLMLWLLSGQSGRR